MAKNDRLVRLLNMVLVIQAFPGKSVRELAGICGVGERQCFRDLRDLQDAGVPIYNDQGYRIVERFKLKDISFALDEALALLYGIKLAERQRGLFRVPASFGFRVGRASLTKRLTSQNVEHGKIIKKSIRTDVP